MAAKYSTELVKSTLSKLGKLMEEEAKLSKEIGDLKRDVKAGMKMCHLDKVETDTARASLVARNKRSVDVDALKEILPKKEFDKVMKKIVDMTALDAAGKRFDISPAVSVESTTSVLTIDRSF
jgi:hypothetical protein